jgi:DNA-directed RNA polymerase specialized sigma24 family protein
VDSSSRGARFPTTRFSALVGARSTDEAERRRSWHTLVDAYWKPVYKHVRVKWRKSREDAQDLTQGFFARAIEKGFFDGYDADRARFRTFVRVCLDRFVANEEEARRRLKRGAGVEPLSLDFDAAEAELGGPTAESAESAFEREWRRCLFGLGVDALRAACDASGKSVRFVVFERYDLCEDEARPSYADLAAELGIPTTTVTNHLSWARGELRRLVLERLAEISGSEREYREEAGSLFGAETP